MERLAQRETGREDDDKADEHDEEPDEAVPPSPSPVGPGMRPRAQGS